MRIAGDGFVLRPAGEAEMDALLALYRQCEDFLALGPVAHASAEMIRGDLAASASAGGVFCGIFDVTDAMLGVADFATQGYNGKRAEAHLALLMLAKPYRGCGLGSKIVRAIETEIWRDEQIEAIAAEVQVNNPAAIRFWRRQRYEIVGGPELVPDGTTVYHLRKQRASEGL
jgi:ribosomal protein S18 acetylase RimI-like enzyme